MNDGAFFGGFPGGGALVVPDGAAATEGDDAGGVAATGAATGATGAAWGSGAGAALSTAAIGAGTIWGWGGFRRALGWATISAGSCAVVTAPAAPIVGGGVAGCAAAVPLPPPTPAGAVVAPEPVETPAVGSTLRGACATATTGAV